MPRRRAAISAEVVADVLAASRRRCCICLALGGDDAEKSGQVAHLDRDPSNDDPDNLAFLCLEHHDKYDSRPRQSKGLTIAEVKRYRTELLAHLARSAVWTDDEIVKALMPALDRPAFRTPFNSESSLPRFRDAIAETINTLNTGLTPQGVQLPAKTQVRNVALRSNIDHVVEALVSLRADFDRLLRSGEIRPCSFGQADCPIFFFTPEASSVMDRARAQLLALAPSLDPTLPDTFYPF